MLRWEGEDTAASRGLAWVHFVTKARHQLTASDLAELYDRLDRKLGEAGIETQPQVAVKILELTRDVSAGMADYARIIRNDAALTGRLLRLANSAYFAQSKPVTSVDRACVLLGLGRLRSIALGFYLSRAASSDASRKLGREVWGQSVYRACLASELARQVCPSQTCEAFVIGLMMDAGIPLSSKLHGEPFDVLLAGRPTPQKLFAEEFAALPFTHVDLIAVLARRWKLPELLTKPLEWHHTPPSDSKRSDPLHLLHRIAYYVGSVALTSEGRPSVATPGASLAERHLGFEPSELGVMVRRTTQEFSVVIDLFSGVADRVENIGAVADAVHSQLVELIDEQACAAISESSRPAPQRFKLGGLEVLVRADDDGLGTACLYDSRGDPLTTHRFVIATETPSTMRTALGLDAQPSDENEAIAAYLSRLAA